MITRQKQKQVKTITPKLIHDSNWVNEGLDGDEDEGSEVVKLKIKRKPPKICESSESDCDDSEVVEATVKRTLPKELHIMSMKNWDLRLCLFCQNTNFKKLCKSAFSIFFLLF